MKPSSDMLLGYIDRERYCPSIYCRSRGEGTKETDVPAQEARCLLGETFAAVVGRSVEL